MKGRVCLVTGASGNVGRALVEGFAAAGAQVFGSLSLRHSAEVQPRPTWVPLHADLTDEHSIRQLFDDVIRQAGTIHIVVHTVGGYASSGPVADTTVEVWDRMMGMNLRSSFLLTREALRRMHRSPFGRIILFGAKSGIGVPAGRVAYGLSKAGVHLLVQTAAQENANAGVTINAIAPGIIDTPENRSSMPDSDRSSWVTKDQIVVAIRTLCEPTNTLSGSIIPM